MPFLEFSGNALAVSDVSFMPLRERRSALQKRLMHITERLNGGLGAASEIALSEMRSKTLNL